MSIHVLRITLRYSKPPIWRRVAVPSDMTLGQLHEVIQMVMPWTNSHLHQFVLSDESLRPSAEELRRAKKADAWDEELFNRMRGQRVFTMKTTPFGDPIEMEGEDEDAVTLGELCPKVKDKLTYEYDFGDGWEHAIAVQKIEEPKKSVEYPVCLSGRLACPPDDCGGMHGYYMLLDAVADPKHPMHEEMSGWVDGGIDPEAFDLDDANAMLKQWREQPAEARSRGEASAEGGPIAFPQMADALSIDEQADAIRTMGDFIAFMERFERESHDTIEQWPNGDLPSYIAGLRGFASDFEGFFRQMGMLSDTDRPPWCVFAQLLLAARVRQDRA